jgi:glycerophosphoryl diester phosphodiesterase
VYAEARRRAVRLVGLLMPLGMIAAVVLTANHFVLDAVAGAVVVAGSLAFVTRRRRGRALRLAASAFPVGAALPRPDHPLAIAHRHGNLVDLLATAAMAGVDLVETDVHAYRRRLEVRHTKSLGPWLWDKWYVVRRDRPPLVLEDLAAALPPGAELMIDIKGWQPWTGRWTALSMERGAPGRPYSVCSRHWRTLRAFRDVPHARVVHSAGSHRQLHRLRRRLSELGGYGVSVHRRLLDESLVADLRKRVAVVMTWPVNDPAALDTVLSLGANGVISDELELLRRMVAERVELTI